MSIKEKINSVRKKIAVLDFLYYRMSRLKYRLLKNIPDEKFLSKKYKKVFKRQINLSNPKSFNEKLQWIKLYDRNPLYTLIVDKYLVRDYVSKKIGDKYLNRLYGVYNSFSEIDFDSLPNSFVLKCNHDSGTIVFCKDKNDFNYQKAKRQLTFSLKTDYYLIGREWPYKNVPRKIIAEEYLVEEEGKQINDYKFYCFNGVPKIMFIISDRGKNTKSDFFDMDFNKLEFTQGYPNSNIVWEKPEKFEEMKRLASILSLGIPEVRVDFYVVNGKVLFGEMTLFDAGGFAKFYPEKWDYIMGEYISLNGENQNG